VAPKLSIIVPVYNERVTLPIILGQVRAQLEAMGLEYEILIVDDGSADGTRDFLATLTSPRERVFLQPENRGKGSALRRGFEEARGEILLVQDADLEYDPRDYPIVLGPILSGDADVVFGSRFLGGPHRVLYYWHSIANRMLTTMSNMVTNLNLTDMEVGYKAFVRSAIEGIEIESDRFGFEPEITAKVAARGLRVFEVPISYRGRTYAEGKKIGLKDAFEAVWVISKYGVRTRLAAQRTEPATPKPPEQRPSIRSVN